METSGIAGLLRAVRTRRRFSQLELAVRAGTTQRHVSFLEQGRSHPGRALVIRLAHALELPLRQRNDLLLAAGYAPAYSRRALDEPALRPVLDAVRHVLDAHLPYPAVAVDRGGDLIAANTAVDLLTAGASPALLAPPVNVYRLALHPEGMAPRIRNLAEWAAHILERLRQESVRDPGLAGLYAELAELVPPPPIGGPLGFAVPLRLASPHGDLRLLTTVTTFATAVDVAVAELKLEAFLPADAATAEALSTR